MSELFGRHRTLPDGAVAASEAREICTPFPEVPSGKINGETARDDGHAAHAVRLSPAGPSESHRAGAEVSQPPARDVPPPESRLNNQSNPGRKTQMKVTTTALATLAALHRRELQRLGPVFKRFLAEIEL